MPIPPDDGRSRDAAATRRRILDAAEERFAADGYDATSIQDISARAGVSRGTPAYFFGSKEHLYRAVLDRSFAGARDLVAGIRAEIADADLAGEAALAAAIGGYYDHLATHPAFVRLVEWESLGDGTRLAELPAHVASLREGVETLAEGVSPKGLPAAEAVHLLIDLIALCWFPLAHAGTLLEGLGIPANDPEFHARRKKHVTGVLLTSLRHREEADA